MKRIAYILALALLITGIYTSCKPDSLEALRDNELSALDKYVKANHLEDAKDSTGIYFKLLSAPTTDSMITAGYKLMLHYNITLNDDSATVVFSTEDEEKHNFIEDPFYVDVSTASISDPSAIQDIAGMHIALKKMRIGEKALVVIPSELAFKALTNASGLNYIPRFSTLLATVTVVEGYAPHK